MAERIDELDFSKFSYLISRITTHQDVRIIEAVNDVITFVENPYKIFFKAFIGAQRGPNAPVDSSFDDDDLIQDVMMKVHQKLLSDASGFLTPWDLANYAKTILIRNLKHKMARESKKEILDTLLLNQLPARSESNPDDVSDKYPGLDKFLMSYRCQISVQIVNLLSDGYSYDDISMMLIIPKVTLYQKVSYLRECVRRRYNIQKADSSQVLS